MQISFKYFILLFLIRTLDLSGQGAELKLVFAGDIMGHDSQIASAYDGKSYNYDTCFSLIKPILDNADIAIANLEVTLAGPPFKGYPQFSSPDELAISAKNAGFDLLINANNHSLDRRKSGLERTNQVLEDKNIIHTGTFNNEYSRIKSYPLIIEKNGIRLALLNYTYGTNGLKVQSPNIVNYIDKETIQKDLQKAKLAKPDFTIVTIHWGSEYQRIQNTEQEDLAKFILDKGANAIIGSHPHVVQPIKTYKYDNENRLVVYSLGNFISNQRKRYTDGGILFEMKLKKDAVSTRLDKYNYFPVWVHKPKKQNAGNYFVLTPSNKEKIFYDSLGMSEPDYQKMKQFNEDILGHLGEMD
ncbi:MAG: CapA family protein [Bacteroidales bacterium]|nr:CapA family protein [Bacteroidales bacterium]